MEFNWADPRKNKRVDSVMMAKAEASRVRRLTSVKSTVSNQLTPAVEHKLKTLKKKKTLEAQDERPSSRLHQRDFELGNNNQTHVPTTTTTTSQSQHQSSRQSQPHSFYNEFLPRAVARPASIFESFDVHAAADGLFHPASNVQAFAEHDARFAAHDKRLPPLSGKSDRSERLASRSESRLRTASSSSSSSRSLGGNKSDGDLHAPRRMGIVPSSADRNTMGFVDEEMDEQEDEPQAASPSPPPVKTKGHTLKTSRRTMDNNDTGNQSQSQRDVPLLALDLTQQFEKLKSLIQTNREKKKERDGPEMEEDVDATATKQTKGSKKPVRDKCTVSVDKKSRTVVLTSSGPSGPSGPSGVRKPKSHKAEEVRVRNGVSLSDLKQEHRAAVAMLQELGGPLSDVDDKKKGRVVKGARPVVRTSVDVAVDRASRLVDKLRARIPSGRDKAPSPRPDEAVASRGGEGTTSTNVSVAAVGREDTAASSRRDEDVEKKTVEDQEDERLWERYRGDDALDTADDDQEDDPSEELYDDEYFEG